MTYEEAIKLLEDEAKREIAYERAYQRGLNEGWKCARKTYEDIFDKIRTEIEQLPTQTRTNWNGCCPDIDYPEIEYVDVSKNKLLRIIDKYKTESEE